MRITNSMMTNTTLININRNMRFLDKLTRQIESTKKINVPSDDPIIASRALKFRTNVAETEQFMRNVENGIAWMNVTESSFKNTIENLLVAFRERCVEGATGTEQVSPDKQAIITELEELIDQIGVEMNQTYAGRYVFSGYRTDQPPVLIEDNNNRFDITQKFYLADMESTKSYQKLVATDEPVVNDIFLMKLAYKGMDGVTLSQLNPDGTKGAPLALTVTTKQRSDADAYTPPDGEIHYIKDTGELIFARDLAEDFTTMAPNGIAVDYTKEGFKKGELNPMSYFECTNLDTSMTFNMDGQHIQYEFATRTYVTVNSLAKDVYTDKMYADLRALCDFAKALPVSDEKVLEQYFRRENPGLSDDEYTKLVNGQMAAEKAKQQSVLHDRFNNMLQIIDRHSEVAMKEHTQMGARGHRLELLRARLEEDEDSYTQLLSDNEDTDMEKAILMQASAYAAYQASLRANTDIVQLSLANFI